MKRIHFIRLLSVMVLVLLVIVAAVACDRGGKPDPADTTVADTTVEITGTETETETEASTTEAETTEAETTEVETTEAETTEVETTEAETTEAETTEAETTEAETTVLEETTSASKATYTVKVADEKGKALEGATVKFYFGDVCLGTLTTGSNGGAIIELGKGNYTVTVTLAGYSGEASYSVTATSRSLKVDLTNNTPDAGFTSPNVTLARYNGKGADPNFLYWNVDGSLDFGQQFNLGQHTLKKVIIDSVGTYLGNENVWTFKIWRWNTNYKTTVDGTPLYEYTGYDLQDCADLEVDIPDGVEITGQVYYEICVLESNGQVGGGSGIAGFMPWIGSNSVDGLVSYANGVRALNNYAARIVIELAAGTETEPEVEEETTIDPDTPLVDCEEIVLGQFVNQNQQHNKWGGMPFGQKFDIGDEYALKRLVIRNLSTITNGENTWRFSIWQWNASSAVTTYSEPLYQVSGKNHPNGQDFIITIPDHIVLTGEFYYELQYMSGPTGFTGWVTNNTVDGLLSFVNGNVTANHFASTIYVTYVGDHSQETETEAETGTPEPTPTGPNVSVNYPSSSLPDFNQYTTASRIEQVLSSRKTFAFTVGGEKYYVNGTLTNGGVGAATSAAGGALTMNPAVLSTIVGKTVTGTTPQAIAAELGMNVAIYDYKLVLFYEGEAPLHTYDDLYTFEAMHLYMTNASQTEILNAFIDLPSRISNNTSNTVFYTAADINLGIQTSIYYAQMGQTNGLLVGPALVAGEGRHEDNFTTVRIYNNQQMCISQFLAFDVSVKGGVQVAAAKVGNETLIATAAFADHDGKNGDVRVFDAYGLLRMTINVRDFMEGPYTIATGHFADGSDNEVLLIMSQKTDAKGRLRYAIVSLSTGSVISMHTLNCAFAGGFAPVQVSVRNNGFTDSVVLYFSTVQAVFEGNVLTHTFQNTHLTLPANATGVSASNVEGQKYTVAVAIQEGSENLSYLTVYDEKASATKVDVGFRENRFFFWAVDSTITNIGTMNDDKYVSLGRFAHVRTDDSDNGIVGLLGNLNSQQVDAVFDSATYEQYASTQTAQYMQIMASQYVFLEPCFTHRWHANYAAVQSLYDYRDPVTGDWKFISVDAKGVHQGYVEAFDDVGTSSFYVGTYADGILEMAKLRIYPLRSFLQGTALAFRGEGANPEHLIGVSPVHEQEITITGSAGDHNPYMVEGFRGYLLDRYGSVANINKTFGTSFTDRASMDAPRNGNRGAWDKFEGEYFKEWVLYNRYIVSKRLMEAYREALLAGYPPESISAHSAPEDIFDNKTLNDTNTDKNFRLSPTDVVLSCGTAYGGTRYGNRGLNNNLVVNAHKIGHSNITLGEYCSNEKAENKNTFQTQDDANHNAYTYLKNYWDNGLRFVHVVTVENAFVPAEVYAFQQLIDANEARPGYTGGTTNSVTVNMQGKMYNIVQIGAGADSDSTGLLKSIDANGKWEGTVYLVPFHTKVNSTEITGLNAPVNGTKNQFSTGVLSTMRNSDQAEITFLARKQGSGRAWVEISVYHQGYLLEDSTSVYELTTAMSPYRYVLSNQLYESGLEIKITFHTESGDPMDSIVVENMYGTLQTEMSFYAYYGERVVKNRAHKGGVTFDLLDRDMLG